MATIPSTIADVSLDLGKFAASQKHMTAMIPNNPPTSKTIHEFRVDVNHLSECESSMMGRFQVYYWLRIFFLTIQLLGNYCFITIHAFS